MWFFRSKRSWKSLEECAYQCFEQILNFVIRFLLNWKRTFTDRKKEGKEIYLQLLGGATNLRLTSVHESRSVLKGMFIEREESFTKLYCVKDDGTTFTSFWRKSYYRQVCSDSFNLYCYLDCSSYEVDKLFRYKGAQEELQKIWKLDNFPKMRSP